MKLEMVVAVIIKISSPYCCRRGVAGSGTRAEIGLAARISLHAARGAGGAPAIPCARCGGCWASSSEGRAAAAAAAGG